MSEGDRLLTLPTGYKPRTTHELEVYVLGQDAVVAAEQKRSTARSETVAFLGVRQNRAPEPTRT